MTFWSGTALALAFIIGFSGLAYMFYLVRKDAKEMKERNSTSKPLTIHGTRNISQSPT